MWGGRGQRRGEGHGGEEEVMMPDGIILVWEVWKYFGKCLSFEVGQHSLLDILTSLSLSEPHR